MLQKIRNMATRVNSYSDLPNIYKKKKKKKRSSCKPFGIFKYNKISVYPGFTVLPVLNHKENVISLYYLLLT